MTDGIPFSDRQVEQLKELFATREQLKELLDERLEAQDIRLVTEFDRRFTEQDQRIDAKFAAQDKLIDAKFTAVNVKLNAHEVRFDRIDAKLDAHEARFDRIDEKLEVMDGKIDALKRRTDEDLLAEGRRISQVQRAVRKLTSPKGAL